MENKQVLLWEMTREEYKKHIESGEFLTAIIPAGSTEQHLEHPGVCRRAGSDEPGPPTAS